MGDGELVDVTLELLSVSRPDDEFVRSYFQCQHEDGAEAVLTVFEDNRPDASLETGGIYRLESVRPERWDDGTQGYVIRPQTVVTPVEGASKGHGQPSERSDGAASEIADNARVDIELTVVTIEQVEDSKVAYRAWCNDRQSGTVVVTVFEDNQPEYRLREGESYTLYNVEGERWPDGTPGVKYRSFSEIERTDAPQSAEPVPSRERSDRIIDSIPLADDYHPMRASVFGGHAGTVISGLVTAIALVASLFAPTLGLAAKVGFIGVGTATAVTAAYVSQTKPNSKLRQRRKGKHVRLYLELLRHDYYKLDCVDTDAVIRANVMLPEKHGFLPKETKLTMFSHVGDYDDSEVELEYEPGQGCCGNAFESGEIEYYDEQTYPHAEADLGAIHGDILSDIGSTVSVPIYTGIGRSGRPAGVVNLDAEVGVDETKFDEDEVHNFVHAYADILGEVIE